MTDFDDERPNPDILLEQLSDEDHDTSGKLKIFFGYSAGVGKTYAMLENAIEQYKCGVDVVVGYVEPHTRPETMNLLDGLPVIPQKLIKHRNIELKEFDLDAALQRKPKLILVDELAHTNAEGARNKKRYQDVEELLSAGIDVFTTVNIQHIESFNDIIQHVTAISVRETIPDYIFDNADQVELIDIEPEELLNRFREGKIYRPERAETALNSFFTKENLRVLREIAMRKAADRLSYNNKNESHLAEKIASKFMVCISPSPSCAKCIRWTARIAEAFHAPWLAVYVENIESQYFSDLDKKNVQEHFSLAARLGAETVTLNGDDVASAVAEYAKFSGITNIVIGKSHARKFMRHYFKTSFEEKLIALVPGIEVHIIPSTPIEARPYTQTKPNLIKMNLTWSWHDVLKMLGLLIIATLISFALRALEIGDQNIIMVYILSVLIVSRITDGYLVGIVSSVLSVLTFNFLFTIPYFTFYTIQSGYPVTFMIMLLVALTTSATTVRIKTQVRLAAIRERRTEILYETNKRLLVTRGLANITELVNNYISNLFERSVILYVKDPAEMTKGVLQQSPADSDAAFMLSEDERAVAHWVYANQKYAGAGTDTLRGAKALYLPIISQGNSLGVIGLSCARGIISQTNYSFLRMIVTLIAMALERQALSDEQRMLQIESEKEKMRSNLLRAISHDLRTPLTGIFGASTAILENRGKIDPEVQNKLLTGIRDDSQWLIRLVENILSVTRIGDGTTHIQKVTEAAEEIVAEAVNRIHQRFPGRRISVQVPQTLLTVPMDGTLIEQVLINLLDNAIKHSPSESEIQVNVTKQAENAVFEIVDHGEGISEQDFPYLFESYLQPRKHGADSSRGMGIGLSICTSIIKAHHGKIDASNNPDGGATLRFNLPLKGD